MIRVPNYYRDRAVAHVRSLCPELCLEVLSVEHWQQPQLQHWLRALYEYGDKHTYKLDMDGTLRQGDWSRLKFNLTTGQPATEADYQAFCEIVGV